ncbi:MAG TPA: RNA-binding S4 domain-containing protein [Gammaproteobacteria bacterium]|nr:RNA-binding S4 domain-containing protein [Gammaproteobacteria bacterium]
MTEVEKVRLDKWLWAARFFKTRSLAAQAVTGGKVHLDGQRVKPARAVNIGNQLVIHRAQQVYVVDVLGLSGRRGPARVAQTLYEETPESIKAREEAAALRKLQNTGLQAGSHRPSGRNRRMIRQFVRKDGDR